jgi:exopolysaccharide biosynthesis polyprenyl glycosylphosphotransferase
MHPKQRVLFALLSLVDAGLVAASWLGAYWLRFYALGLPTPYGLPGAGAYVWFEAFVVPTTLLVFRSLGLYDLHRTLGAELRALLRGVVLVVLASGVMSYFSRGELSRSTVLLFAGLAFVAVALVRIAFHAVLRAQRRRGRYLERAVIVGTGAPALALARKFGAAGEHGVSLLGFVSSDPADAGRSPGGVPVVGAVGELPGLVERLGAQSVYLALLRSEYAAEEEALRRLADSAAAVRLVPDLSQSLLLNASVEDFAGTPVVSLTTRPGESVPGVLKRIFDLVVSAMALVVLAPLLAVLAIWIRLDSEGPALIVQERVGLSGQTFPMLKFRTMRVDAEREGPGWTRPGDPRRTRLGAWLRRFSLDELPQLWNVAVGHMSLVGPRPERPAFVERFRASVPSYMLRHHVRAGITGWAQVNGLRGDTPIVSPDRARSLLHHALVVRVRSADPGPDDGEDPPRRERPVACEVRARSNACMNCASNRGAENGSARPTRAAASGAASPRRRIAAHSPSTL